MFPKTMTKNGIELQRLAVCRKAGEEPRAMYLAQSRLGPEHLVFDPQHRVVGMGPGFHQAMLFLVHGEFAETME